MGGNGAQWGQTWAKLTGPGGKTVRARLRMEINRGAIPGLQYGRLVCLRCGSGTLIWSGLLLLLSNFVTTVTAPKSMKFVGFSVISFVHQP